MNTLDPRTLSDTAKALEPFTTFAANNVEKTDDGWQWTGCSRDRICDWFGPSDFGLLQHFASASAQPVAWGTFARAICESEGRDWTALDNPREDCERWIKAGHACALASPQPALAVKGVTDASRVADALEACDWSGPSIGNKAILQRAVEILRSAPGDCNVEAIAKVISLSYGENPDDDAPLSTICGPNNEPLPNWMTYEEQAEAVFAWIGKHVASASTKGTGANMYRAPVDDGELQEWANLRADDAGRLARELIGYRRAALPAAPTATGGR